MQSFPLALRQGHVPWSVEPDMVNSSCSPHDQATSRRLCTLGKERKLLTRIRGQTTRRKKPPSSVAPETETSKRKPLNYTILKTLLNIEEILGANRWKQRSSRGAQMRGACPLCNHQDERAFAANRSKNVYCCHRCDSKGNSLDLLAKLSNTPIHEAAWDWIDRKQLTPPLL